MFNLFMGNKSQCDTDDHIITEIEKINQLVSESGCSFVAED